jgi:hypothetical protein
MSAIFIAILVFCCYCSLAPATAEQLTAGVRHESIAVAGGGVIDVIVVEDQKARARVISSLSTSNARTYGFNVAGSMTISDYYFDANPIAVVSGGFLRRYSPPTPSGMLIINNRQISRETLTWSGKGMFCADDQGYFVGRFDQDKANSYSDCVQSGPLFIEDGNVRYEAESKISEEEINWVNQIVMQAFVCVASDGNLVFGVSTAMGLDFFAKLAKKRLKCVNAIRLTGDDTAGLYYARNLIGNDDLPLTSVIAIFQR